jgi:hypothetical protein
MRIPTSVIVMSLVTALPFGLAIRDTLREKKQGIDTGWTSYTPYSGDSPRRDRETYEEYMREREREELARAEQRQQRLAALDQIYGSSAASMGRLFDGIALGASPDSFQPEATRERIERVRRDGLIDVSFDVDTRAVSSLTVTVDGSDYDPTTGEVLDTCATLREKLIAAWGPSTGGVWLAPTTHYRARFESAPCALTFERYVDIENWLAAVTPNLIGSKAAPAIELNAAKLEENESYAAWHMPGIGAGRTDTWVGITIGKGKITSIEARTTTDFDTGVQIRERLTELLNVKPTEDGETGDWMWKRPGKLPVRLSHSDGGSLLLYVGKQ